jgi:DNA repair protein RadC
MKQTTAQIAYERMIEEIPILSLERVGLAKVQLKQIKNTQNAVSILQSVFEQNMPNQISVNEYFVALIMNHQAEVIGIYIVGKGGIDATIGDTRLIMASILLLGGTGVIICHNHPSGGRKPSEADLLVTKSVSRACEYMNIILFDHIILFPEKTLAEGELGYYSFAVNKKL